MAYTQPKGPLSSSDCRNLTIHLNAATSYVSSISTVADAEAAGWEQAAVWSSGQGIHYVTEMKPARQILSDIVEEALDVFDRFADDEE